MPCMPLSNGNTPLRAAKYYFSISYGEGGLPIFGQSWVTIF